MRMTESTSLETGFVPSNTSPTAYDQASKTCHRMSSRLSVGEFGCTRAPIYPFAPILLPGRTLKILEPTWMSSPLVINFTTHPITWLESPGIADRIVASSCCSKNDLSLPSVSAAVFETARRSIASMANRWSRSSSTTWRSMSATLVLASNFRAAARAASLEAATPTRAPPSLNSLAAPRMYW